MLRSALLLLTALGIATATAPMPDTQASRRPYAPALSDTVQAGSRASGYRSPMWQLVARAESGAPDAEWWVSQRHHFVDQALVSEPGVAMRYEREGL